VPAFVQLTFEQPGPTGISWCCRAITPLPTTADADADADADTNTDEEDRDDDDDDDDDMHNPPASNSSGGIGGSDSGSDLRGDETGAPGNQRRADGEKGQPARCRLPPKVQSSVATQGDVNDASGRCVALVASVAQGSAADRLVSTAAGGGGKLSPVDRVLLLRGGVEVALEAINGVSVHSPHAHAEQGGGEQGQSYAAMMQSLRTAKRPLTLLLRTHALGTEPALAKKVSSSSLPRQQRHRLDGAAAAAASAAKAAAWVASTGAELQQYQKRQRQQERQQLMSDRGETTTDDEDDFDAHSMADSIDCSPSSPSPTPSIGAYHHPHPHASHSPLPFLIQFVPSSSTCKTTTANCIIIDHFSAFEPGLVAPFLYVA
jgi:hypothetical protein